MLYKGGPKSKPLSGIITNRIKNRH